MRVPTSLPLLPTWGGLGTLGLAPPDELRESIARVREGAPGRAVAVNLLTPFLRRSHVSVCIGADVDVAVVAFGGDRELVDELGEAGVFVFVMVGTQDQARRAVSWASGCRPGAGGTLKLWVECCSSTAHAGCAPGPGISC